jgi:ABC-2 type transport system permease protein
MHHAIGHRYLTAARYALLEQVRNRFALVLLLLFVPSWYYMGFLFTTDTPIAFKFRLTNVFLQVSAREVTFLTLGLNAITLIVGFMLFTATRKNTRFDHRLVLNGYPQPLLILAKLTSLVAVAAAVSLYASAVLYAYWRPHSLPLVWLGFFCAALCYGGLGLLLGVLVRGELEGFFLIIMLSLIDTFIQNPIGNPAANQEIVKGFPAFAPMQVAVAGGFTTVAPWLYVLISLAWLAGFALLGLLIFWWKTRAWSVHSEPLSAGSTAASERRLRSKNV